MKAFIVHDSYIKEIIRSSTLSETAKHIFMKSVLDSTQTLTQFVFDVFSYYMPAYEQSEINGNPYQYANHVKEVFGPLIDKFQNSDDTSIRVIDPFDAIYNRSFPGTDTTLDSYLFDAVYNSVESIFGEDVANNYFGEVVQLIEYVVICLEMGFINLNKDHSEAYKLFFSYSGNQLTIFVH